MNPLQWSKSTYSDASGGNCIEVAFDWFKSSYSDSSGGECIEVAFDWFKSSYSDSSGGACVEVAIQPGATVHVRDSKNPEGPSLTFDPAAWVAFLHFATQIGESPSV